jgi:hypothetical protein
MLRPTLHRMQVPATHPAMGGNRFLDGHPLHVVKFYGFFCHPPQGQGLPPRLRAVNPTSAIDPAAAVTREPRTVGRPSEKKSERIGTRNRADDSHDKRLARGVDEESIQKYISLPLDGHPTQTQTVCVPEILITSRPLANVLTVRFSDRPHSLSLRFGL